ncbi:hypothetical protein SAY86_027888 [Trapa natans]|uniref:Uncharacterized protein n=1 Tax=Trapa natans TaxID=22666 RepID=A0AAN7MBX1_TRANT|nr:hypothetical protein SAY86_027888 [Trapa natans]
MIKQQLMNTEDLHRMQKKAPCTLPEISMIQRQFLEDEIFSEPALAGQFPIQFILVYLRGFHKRKCFFSIKNNILNGLLAIRTPCLWVLSTLVKSGYPLILPIDKLQ